MHLPRLSFALVAAILGNSLLADETKPADNVPKLAYGQMLKQGDKLVFAPCRDRSYLLVDDISTDGSVSKGLKQVGLDAGKKLYVEFVALVEGNALKASRLNFARTDGRCQQPGGADEAWRATGSEPAWAMAAGGEQVMLKRQGKPDLVLPYTPFTGQGGSFYYEAPKGGEPLAVRLDPVLCRDSVADTVFGWTATLKLNGQTLKGCAWQR